MRPPYGATVRFALAASVQTGIGPHAIGVRYWDGTAVWGAFDWAHVYPSRTQAGEALDTALARPASTLTDRDNARLIRVWISRNGNLLRATHGQDWEDLGARLRRARRVSEVTHERASAETKVPHRTLNDIEAGRRKVYAAEYARLCLLYGVDPDELLAGLAEEIRRRTAPDR
jgi:hypothetical protein